ncbi:uncharacterized protein B0H64DRAFT_247407 [Chaetomium fimeti]|uniref:Uncharacterized protein n=1 Tax=Chaetomium fimeti TaxID=1854472 RepID=A0AAE0H7R0_9PEZI|nr:hypothetical protein B0H64DRAFT_247407 [Chaetomium fimeti]
MPQESLRRPRQEEARPGGGGRQTRSKRQRQLAEDALSSSAALTPSPDAGVTPCPAAVAAPSPDDSPAPDAPPTADVPASPDALPCLDSPPLHNVTAVPPLDTVPSSPPGAVVPATTSTALLSPAAVVAAPLTVSGNEPDTEKVANRQTFRILETCYGNAMDGFRAVEAWSELEGAIMSLVRCHFVKVVPWDTLDVSTREKLSIWAPHAGDYLESAFESHSKLRGP